MSEKDASKHLIAVNTYICKILFRLKVNVILISFQFCRNDIISSACIWWFRYKCAFVHEVPFKSPTLTLQQLAHFRFKKRKAIWSHITKEHNSRNGSHVRNIGNKYVTKSNWTIPLTAWVTSSVRSAITDLLKSSRKAHQTRVKKCQTPIK